MPGTWPQLEGARLVGVTDIDSGRARAVAEELGYRSLRAWIALLGRVEAVTIAVPTPAHAEVGLRALERGIPVLMEKPLAATLEEADRLIAAAAAKRSAAPGRAHRALQPRHPRGGALPRRPALHREPPAGAVPAPRDRRRRRARPHDPRPRSGAPPHRRRRGHRGSRLGALGALLPPGHRERAGRVRQWGGGAGHRLARVAGARATAAAVPAQRLLLPRPRDRRRRVHAAAQRLAPGHRVPARRTWSSGWCSRLPRPMRSRWSCRASCTRCGAIARSWSGGAEGRAALALALRVADVVQTSAARRTRGGMITRAGPRIFVSAGEPSGDLHGAGVVRALRERYPNASIEALGGPRMAQAGATVRYPMEGLAAFGFVEIVSKLGAHLRLLRALRQDFRAGRYDLVILIDYPGFHLRVAEAARTAGTKVLYYIAPQLWAWRPERARRLAAAVDRLAVVLPFEQPFFGGLGLRSEYVGHPLVDRAPAPTARGRAREPRHSAGEQGAWPLSGEPGAGDPAAVGALPRRRRALARGRPLRPGARGRDGVGPVSGARLGRDRARRPRTAPGRCRTRRWSSPARRRWRRRWRARPWWSRTRFTRSPISSRQRVRTVEWVSLVNLVAGSRSGARAAPGPRGGRVPGRCAPAAAGSATIPRTRRPAGGLRPGAKAAGRAGRHHAGRGARGASCWAREGQDPARPPPGP